MDMVANPLREARQSTNQSIKWLNSVHEYMALWLIANPHRHQSELAQEIGYTEAWISTVIHSDMFQAAYRELCGTYQEVAVEGIGEKVNAAAMEALAAMREKIRNRACSEQFLLGATKTLLGAIGYGAPKVEPQAHSHMHLHVSREDILESRARMEARYSSRALPSGRADVDVSEEGSLALGGFAPGAIAE
jgi:hypothetical protein